MEHNDFRDSINSDISVLDQLANQIRDAHESVQATGANALAHALKAGAGIVEAHNRGATMAWVCKSCSLAASTARLYRQLAESRAEIEVERDKRPNLSLREARRLIAKPKQKSDRQDASKEDQERSAEPANSRLPWEAALIASSEWSDDVWTAVLVAKGIDSFLRVMPTAWRPRLQQLAGGQAIEHLKSKYPDTRVKHLSRKHLQLVAGIDAPSAPH